MKAAIYNQFWASMGGGERHSAMIAQLLSQSGHQVDLLGHRDVSIEELSARLVLDLSKTRLRLVPDLGEYAIAELSGEYDLFVNSTYMSRVKARSKRSAYLCFFPTPHDHDLSQFRRSLIRHLGPHVRRTVDHSGFRWGTGWYPPEGGRRRQWTWSNGSAVLMLDAGPESVIQADIGRPGAGEPAELTVFLDDKVEVARIHVTPAFTRHTFTVPAQLSGRRLTFGSSTFVPGASDSRQLGIAVSRLRRGGQMTPVERMGNRFPWLTRDPADVSFVPSYDVILANSTYTQQWIERSWGAHSEVLYPPIIIDRLTPAPVRTPLILSVGRFFAPNYGHSKRQLDMVQMFGRLVRSGQLPGWRFAVVGGCEDGQRDYLRQVRHAAEGLPVDIHPNAPRALLEELMSTASIFWSATGLGEDTEKRPWTNEHFGMTTAEAMAGGCVPVVIDRAGQREIVRQGIDGFRWQDEHQLRIRTVQVATDDQLRQRLSASALQRVHDFSDAAFAARWRELSATYDLELLDSAVRTEQSEATEDA